MNGFNLSAIAPKIGKFAGLIQRTFKPNAQKIQTLFNAADKATPQFKAACAGMDRTRAVMSGGVI
jgi:hypothetical protein